MHFSEKITIYKPCNILLANTTRIDFICRYITDSVKYTSVIPEVYMGIVLPKAAGMQEISFLYEEIRRILGKASILLFVCVSQKEINYLSCH